MQNAAARPWLITGVALLSAGAIASGPVTAPVPALAGPQSLAVQLTAGWDDVWQTAEANATAIWNHFSAVPFPALQQVLANQIGYVHGVFDGSKSFGDIAQEVHTHLGALFGTPADGDTPASPGALFGPFLPAGGATDTLYQSLDDVVTGPGMIGSVMTHAALFTLLTDPAILPDIAASLGFDESMVPVLGSVLEFAASPLSGILIGQVSTMLSPVLQFNEDLGNIWESLSAGSPDWSAAFDSLISMPANLADAYLNGYGEVDLMPILDQLGITLPALTLLDLPTEITALSVNLGGLLSPAGSIFDAIGMGTTTDALGDPELLFDLPGLGVGPIASMVAMSQAIAEAFGWDGSSDLLASLF
ncbi:hypothetical protein AWC02_19720 [Mycolicibacter engbaekii]|uniref:PE-PGRS family protein n=1 Tax=Mycolicibacter engbaekii TaxID=188915 RepID=A0A1X1T530_9MYCO|nr:outer membrane porin GjpA [Mycolicibacter engbaekii]ORV39608.1 hypothetical protein AWC02_19720 [Mycolicibacter engbaekii]